MDDDWSDEMHATQDRFHLEVMRVLLDRFEQTGDFDWDAAFEEAARREVKGYKETE